MNVAACEGRNRSEKWRGAKEKDDHAGRPSGETKIISKRQVKYRVLDTEHSICTLRVFIVVKQPDRFKCEKRKRAGSVTEGRSTTIVSRVGRD